MTISIRQQDNKIYIYRKCINIYHFKWLGSLLSISKLRIKDDLPSKLYRIPRQQYTSNIQQYTSSEYNREIRVNRKHQPTNIDAKNFSFHMDSLLSGRKLSRDILALPSRDSIHYSCFSSCKFTLLSVCILNLFTLNHIKCN